MRLPSPNLGQNTTLTDWLAVLQQEEIRIIHPGELRLERPPSCGLVAILSSLSLSFSLSRPENLTRMCFTPIFLCKTLLLQYYYDYYQMIPVLLLQTYRKYYNL